MERGDVAPFGPGRRAFSVVGDHRDVGLDEREGAPFGERRAVFEVARDGPLARVEVDDADPRPGMGQRDGDMDGGRRLARAALLVAEHDQMCLLRRHCPVPAHDRRFPYRRS